MEVVISLPLQEREKERKKEEIIILYSSSQSFIAV